MNRRRFLAVSGSVGGSLGAGCLEGTVSDIDDGGSQSSPAADAADSDRQLQPLAGDGGGVSGNADSLYTDIAALLRSPDDLDSILPVFSEDAHDAVSTYVDETNFDREAIVMYATSLPTPAYTLVFDGTTVESDRIVAEFSSEQESGIVPQAEVPVAALKRLEIGDPPPVLVAEWRDDTVSNQYAVQLEQLPQSELDERLDVVTVSEVPADSRPAVRRAIEDGATDLETVPESLARTVADHAYARDGDDYYELSGTLPTHVLTAETYRRDEMGSELNSATGLDLRYIRDESEPAYEMVTTAIRDGEAHRAALPPELERVLEEYDYVWRHPTFVKLSATVEDPGSPYRLQATPVSRATVLTDLDEAGGIVTYDDLPEAAQSEVDAALEGPHEVTNPPALCETHPPSLRTTDTPSVVVGDAVYQPEITDIVGEPEWQR